MLVPTTGISICWRVGLGTHFGSQHFTHPSGNSLYSSANSLLSSSDNPSNGSPPPSDEAEVDRVKSAPLPLPLDPPFVVLASGLLTMALSYDGGASVELMVAGFVVVDE